jgi:hypothetical protein
MKDYKKDLVDFHSSYAIYKAANKILFDNRARNNIALAAQKIKLALQLAQINKNRVWLDGVSEQPKTHWVEV